jgi:hypothetical protein
MVENCETLPSTPFLGHGDIFPESYNKIRLPYNIAGYTGDL